MSCSSDERVCCPRERTLTALVSETFSFIVTFFIIWIVAYVLHLVLYRVFTSVERSVIPVVWRYLKRKYYATKHRYYRREWDVEITLEKHKKNR